MKLNYKRTLLVGLAFLSISAFWQLYDFTIPLILRNQFQISDTAAGVVMSLDNIVALFLLPVFGTLSDKVRTRFGRRMPFVVLGTTIACVMILLVPLAVTEHSLVLFMVALGLVLLFMSTYRSPAVALMPDVTPKSLRSKGNAVINLMGAVGGIMTLGVISLLAPKGSSSNYFPVFLCVVGIMLAGILAMAFTVKETAWADEAQRAEPDTAAEEQPQDEEKPAKMAGDVRRSMVFLLVSIALWFMAYNAITSAWSKYATNRLDMTTSAAANILLFAQIAAIVSFIPVGAFSFRIGRKKSILLGVGILAAVFGSAFFYTSFHPLMYVSFSLAGMAWALINVNSLPMVVQMTDSRGNGKYTGYYYTFSMAAQVITPILSGFLLEHAGYWTLFPYAGLFGVFAFCTMLFVRHGDAAGSVPKDKLTMYDVAD